jgi:hypothetical protein
MGEGLDADVTRQTRLRGDLAKAVEQLKRGAGKGLLLYQLSYAGERTAQLSLQDRREQVVAEPGKAGQLLPCECAKWPSEYQKELGDPAD